MAVRQRSLDGLSIIVAIKPGSRIAHPKRIVAAS